MHELAIADSIVNTILEEAKKQNLGSVVAVGLRIGALTDIVPEALEFGFSAITDGTLLEGTKLKIESVPVKGMCNGCGKTFEVKRFCFVCPECNASDIKVDQGQELDIAYIEVNDS